MNLEIVFESVKKTDKFVLENKCIMDSYRYLYKCADSKLDCKNSYL